MSRPRSVPAVCTIPNCGAHGYSRGLCKRHYCRVWRHGDASVGDAKQKFDAHVRKTDSCWLWDGPRFASGYGRASQGSRKRRAHRVAYELYVAPIPEGMHVLHRCDNPPCVNPDHLFLGTHLDNMKDMERKGRAKWIQNNLRASL